MSITFKPPPIAVSVGNAIIGWLTVEGPGDELGCEACGNSIVDNCFVSIGPEQVVFCFGCANYDGQPSLPADRVICALAAAARQGGDVRQAPGEAPQSGPAKQGNAQ